MSNQVDFKTFWKDKPREGTDPAWLEARRDKLTKALALLKRLRDLRRQQYFKLQELERLLKQELTSLGGPVPQTAANQRAAAAEAAS